HAGAGGEERRAGRHGRRREDATPPRMPDGGGDLGPPDGPRRRHPLRRPSALRCLRPAPPASRPAGGRGGRGSGGVSPTLLRRPRRPLRGHRFVLCVDDAHLLDHASATLLHHLVVSGLAFVVATVRIGEATPDPVVALWKDGLAERLDLTGLRSEAIEELLGLALEGPIDRAAVARFSLRCQGNVLYLRELVAGALDTQVLVNEGGIWRLTRELIPSDRLVELVETRLSGLTDLERWLLEVVALGEPVGSAELRTLADLSLVEALERHGLVASRVNGRRLEVHLAHPLYGEVLRARLSPLRARSIASSLARAVEGTGARRREDTLRVGTWQLESGEG